MRTTLALAALAALAVFGGFLAQQLTAPAEADGGAAKTPHRVAVANIRTLFEKAEETREREKALQADHNKRKKKLDYELKKLEAERKRLESGRLDKASTRYRAKLKDLVGRYETLKAKSAWEADDFKRKMRRKTEELYEQIVAEVQAYAKEHGIDLVLKIDDVPEESNSDGALAAKINRRGILFASKRIDITDAVLRRLNRRE